MSLVIDLAPEIEERLNEEARRCGLAPSNLVQGILEERLGGVTSPRKRRVEGYGMLAGKPGAVDEFLRLKYEDIEREEQRWQERYGADRP